MSAYKELEQKADNLQLELDAKEIELLMVQSELADAKEPYRIQSEIISITIEMLSEFLNHAAKNGDSETNKYRRDRLMRLNELIDKFSTTTTAIHNVHLLNRSIAGKYQLLYAEYKKVKDELKKLKDAESF